MWTFAPVITTRPPPSIGSAVSAVREWREAIAAGDSFRFDKIGGDSALISGLGFV